MPALNWRIGGEAEARRIWHAANSRMVHFLGPRLRPLQHCAGHRGQRGRSEASAARLMAGGATDRWKKYSGRSATPAHAGWRAVYRQLSPSALLGDGRILCVRQSGEAGQRRWPPPAVVCGPGAVARLPPQPVPRAQHIRLATHRGVPALSPQATTGVSERSTTDATSARIAPTAVAPDTSRRRCRRSRPRARSPWT